MLPSSDDSTPPHWLKTKVSTWFWSLTPTCREVTRLTSEERERALPLGTRLRLGMHRRFCEWCARYAGQLDLMHEASRRLPEHGEDLGGPGMADETKARMKRALGQAAGRE